MIEHVLSESGGRSHRCSPLFTALLAPLAKAAHGAVLYGRVALALKVCWLGACAHANQYAVTSVPRACQLLAGRTETVDVLPPFWSFADRTGTAKPKAPRGGAGVLFSGLVLASIQSHLSKATIGNTRSA